MWLWKQFPRQIASDLSQYHNRRIADWHRGTRDEHGYLVLSSYELLELSETLPERSAFKSAIRGGEWSTEEAMLAHTANEIAKLRATLQVVHGGKDAAYDPKVFFSVTERLEAMEREEAVDEARESVFDFADFSDKITPRELEEWDED